MDDEKTEKGKEKKVADENTSKKKGEKERLARQASVYFRFDISAVEYVMSCFKRKDLTVLDIGCSNGVLTITRFGDFPEVKNVIGIDCNKADIENADELAKIHDGKFKFYCLDPEAEDVTERLREILKANGAEKVDVVFAPLVLHRLKNPNALLAKLRELMSDDGMIIVRGSDDGSKLCYPKTELLKEILDRYDRLVNTSDRFNGRKIYGQLYGAGFRDIKMLYSVTDTCGRSREERAQFFKMGFGARLNIVDSVISKTGMNERLSEERQWLERALKEFEQAFCREDFWYTTTAYIAIASVGK